MMTASHAKHQNARFRSPWHASVRAMDRPATGKLFSSNKKLLPLSGAGAEMCNAKKTTLRPLLTAPQEPKFIRAHGAPTIGRTYCRP